MGRRPAARPGAGPAPGWTRRSVRRPRTLEGRGAGARLQPRSAGPRLRATGRPRAGPRRRTESRLRQAGQGDVRAWALVRRRWRSGSRSVRRSWWRRESRLRPGRPSAVRRSRAGPWGRPRLQPIGPAVPRARGGRATRTGRATGTGRPARRRPAPAARRSRVSGASTGRTATGGSPALGRRGRSRRGRGPRTHGRVRRGLGARSRCAGPRRRDPGGRADRAR